MKKIIAIILLIITCFFVLVGCQTAITQNADFSFLWNVNILALFLGIIVFGIWQIAKLIRPQFFNPIDEKQKQKVAILITNINGLVAIIFAVFAVGFKLAPDIPAGIAVMFTVFSNGSIYDLLKAYGAVK